MNTKMNVVQGDAFCRIGQRLLHKNSGTKRDLAEGDEFIDITWGRSGDDFEARVTRGIWGAKPAKPSKRKTFNFKARETLERVVHNCTIAVLEEGFQSPLSPYVGE